MMMLFNGYGRDWLKEQEHDLPHDFSDLEPYGDHQVAAILLELANHPAIHDLLARMFHVADPQSLLAVFHHINTVAEFQAKVMAPAVDFVIDQTTDGLTVGGLENLESDSCHLFISNHRDISLDSSLLARALQKNTGRTMQMAIGDNLMMADWLSHLFKLNKTVIVERSLPRRALFRASQRLSRYIHHLVHQQKDSFWIAQAEGRAKDGNDLTQSSLVKMLTLGADKDWPEYFLEMNPVPVSISYEYDPCDTAKARELNMTSQTGSYEKAEGEDLTSIAAGLTGSKGRVHIEIGTPLAKSWQIPNGCASKGERLEHLLHELDRQILGSYKLWPTNYLAKDLLNGDKANGSYYQDQDVVAFEQRLARQLGDGPEAKQIRMIVLEMYANPVRNKLKAKVSYH